MSARADSRRLTAADIRICKGGTVEEYAADVRARALPGPDNVYGMKAAKSAT